MATLSPAVSNIITNDARNSPATPNGGTAPVRSISLDYPNLPKQNLRGMNKPKCIKCGNVARSRCPFQSCKGCCSKAQNPCHIHVLKQTSTLPDKLPPSSSPLPEQPSTDGSSKGAALRLSSLRQLSSTFANSLRTRRPLTRKDAININKWRFSKLREYIDGNIEVENEAFDRYMQNVSLLEETFSVEKTLDVLDPHAMPRLEPSFKDESEQLISAIKLKLQFDSQRAKERKERIQVIVNKGLDKLQRQDGNGDDDYGCDDHTGSFADAFDGCREHKRQKKSLEVRLDRAVMMTDLVDKLSKARTEDDLKSCLDIKLKLHIEGRYNDELTAYREALPDNEAQSSMPAVVSYTLPKLCTTIQITEKNLSNDELHFSSSDELGKL